MMDKNSRIFVAGHRGMVGSAITRLLEREGFAKIIRRTSQELDLRNQAAVSDFFQQERPEYVFLAAAKVGGISANNIYRADFLYDNLAIESNIIHSAFKHNVKKLLFLGSSCIYPKFSPQPMKEEYLLTGLLEPTNEPYAIAKIAGIKLCESFRDQYGCNFISVMPTNLYGQGDNYHLENSHVIPAMIRKFHEAKISRSKTATIWGTGSPQREFMYVDDLADACLFLMNNYNDRLFVNAGSGEEITISTLAERIQKVVGFEGQIEFDSTKPDGTPRKLMDSSRLFSMGWKPKCSLETGLKNTYEHFLKEIKAAN
jgi:GDP-L-fucose synthase